MKVEITVDGQVLTNVIRELRGESDDTTKTKED